MTDSEPTMFMYSQNVDSFTFFGPFEDMVMTFAESYDYNSAWECQKASYSPICQEDVEDVGAEAWPPAINFQWLIVNQQCWLFLFFGPFQNMVMTFAESYDFYHTWEKQTHAPKINVGEEAYHLQLIVNDWQWTNNVHVFPKCWLI